MVRNSFSRGLEPVTYVAIVLKRFDHYEHFVVDGAPTAPEVEVQLEEGRERVRDRRFRRPLTVR